MVYSNEPAKYEGTLFLTKDFWFLAKYLNKQVSIENIYNYGSTKQLERKKILCLNLTVEALVDPLAIPNEGSKLLDAKMDFKLTASSFMGSSLKTRSKKVMAVKG